MERAELIRMGGYRSDLRAEGTLEGTVSLEWERKTKRRKKAAEASREVGRWYCVTLCSTGHKYFWVPVSAVRVERVPFSTFALASNHG